MMRHLGDFITGKTGHSCLICLHLSKKFKMMLVKSSLKKVPLLKMSPSFYWAVNPFLSTFPPVSLKLSMSYLYWSSTHRICICRPQFHLWCGPISQLQPCFLEACTCSSPSAPHATAFPTLGSSFFYSRAWWGQGPMLQLPFWPPPLPDAECTHGV